MRQETIIKTFLTFNELNEEQQKKVLDNYHDINIDFNWYDSDIELFKSDLKILGFRYIEISFSGFSSQGDGACFTALYSMPKNKKEVIKDFKNNNGCEKFLDIAERLLALNLDMNETYHLYSNNSRYCHENTISCDNLELLEVCREYMRLIYKSLENQYYYLISNEAIKETLIANDYEFDIDTLKIG